MASLKEIRTRITSVKNTRQVTSAMKMVSAAKLKKAQDNIMQIRPYADKLHEILYNLSDSLGDSDDNFYGVNRVPEKVLLVVITSNKGLCGSFNANVIKKATLLADQTYVSQNQRGNLQILALGKQGYEYLRKRYSVMGPYSEIFDNLSFDYVANIAEELMDRFVKGEYDRIELVYNQFKNAGVQILTREQFLPVEISDEDRRCQEYIFEPSQECIVNELIPKSLKVQLFKAMLDSFASEHGARMTAMHMATDNASELLRELNLNYNKARQASITNEILEIVSGAEALSKG